MVRSELTSQLIADGEVLIRDLDTHRLRVEAAFWFLAPDLDAWKLLIASPLTTSKGPKRAYQQIQKSLNRLKGRIQELRLDDVAILRPDEPLLTLLRVALRTGPGISGIRFTGNVINGQFIPDAHIYRIT